MSVKGENFCPRCNVPNSSGAVIRRGNDTRAVRTEARGTDPVLMTSQHRDFIARVSIPKPRRLVRGRSNDLRSAEGGRSNRSGMTSERAYEGAGTRIQYLYFCALNERSGD